MNPQDIRDNLTISGVPPHMHDGYVRYLCDRIEPGGFLYSVLSNDLRGAWGRADRINRGAIGQHLIFLTTYAPSACWGSPARVDQWLNAKPEPPA